MNKLIITTHAIERYFERVLNIKNLWNVSKKDIFIIRLRLSAIFKKYNELSQKEGYYLLKDNVYCLVKESAIITVIVKENASGSYYKTSAEIKKANKEIDFISLKKATRKKNARIKNPCDRNAKPQTHTYYGAIQPATSEIELLLEKARNQNRKVA
jgi:hypothetical protein